MIHDLKSWPESFGPIMSGAKRHDIRKMDRPFKVGDQLNLIEWDPIAERKTGRTFLVDVTYVTEGGNWSLPGDVCVMSIRRAEWES